MSLVIVTPETVAAAASDVARIGSGAGIAQVGGREMDEMRPIGTLDNGGQGGVGSDGWVGGQNGTVEFVEPFLGRVEGDSRCLADQLMYSR
ncbi:putative PE family protein [Mycobacterium tuberculosis]|nr:putative PE family protein [Mycobacterium tuberculosis]